VTGSTSVTSRDRRAELLALASPEDLVDLAERCLALGAPSSVVGVDVGVVVLQVREPVVQERFNLAEVLATRAEVVHRGERGWSMRLGDEREATLAAAVLDAEAASGGPFAPEVHDLCQRTERAERRSAAAEWSELAPTIVRFEELG
jgi:alpha-D-ribose 1-methylphosphonate 5-triphosphate synthase subunit PhnG